MLGTQVIGRGSRLHFLAGSDWYQLDVDDIPRYPRARQAAGIADRKTGARRWASAVSGRSLEVVRLAGQPDDADDMPVPKRQADLAAFCVVANIADQTAHSEGGLELRRGLRHFPPGAKVWVLPG